MRRDLAGCTVGRMNGRNTLAPLPFVVTTFVVSLGLLVSCGDDAKKGIAKTDFLTAGNGTCTAFNETMDEAGAAVATEADAVAFVSATFVPGLRGVLQSIENLGFPEGDAALIQGLIDDTREVLDGVEADPLAFVQAESNPFADINEQLHAYGLTACGTAD